MTTFEVIIAIYLGLLVPVFVTIHSTGQRRIWGEIAALRTETRAEFAAVRSEIAGLRGDILQVALAVGARPPLAEA